MSGAWSHGKGDRARPKSVPYEVYDLRYDLAIGRITRREFDEQIDAAWEAAKKRQSK